MQWTVVSRVRMDKQGKSAYQLAFSKTFTKCKADNPNFELGRSLLGVWSDAEIQGLGGAVGPDIARRLLKGCSVHWSRSWQRVRNQVLGSSNKECEKKLFGFIAAHIQNAPCGEQVALCFEVCVDPNQLACYLEIYPTSQMKMLHTYLSLIHI